MKRHCIIRLVLFIALLILIVAGSPGSGFDAAGEDGIMVMGPDKRRFIPDAESWSLNFTAVDTGEYNTSPGVSLYRVLLDGKPVDLKDVNIKYEENGEIPLLQTASFVPKSMMEEYNFYRNAPKRLEGVTGAQKERLSQIVETIEDVIWENPVIDRPEYANVITIDTDNLAIENNEEYKVTVEFAVSRRGEHIDTISFNTDITVVDIDVYPAQSRSGSGDAEVQAGGGMWVPGDYHVHSENSDGRRTTEELKQLHINAGFQIAYWTDGHHTKELVTDEEWHQLRSDYLLLSDENITIFPGVETAINPDDDGHLLVYGTNDTIMGLEENLKNHQEMIDEGLANNRDAPSSTAIAHPDCEFFPWDDFNVIDYHGIEIMVGGVPLLHGGSGLGSGHVSRWRSEMARLMNHIINNGGYVPSARTGTDFHGYPLEIFREWVTWVYVPDDWNSMGYHHRKSAVDRSLYEGVTTVSSDGSFGNFTLKGEMVGSVMHGVNSGTSMDLEVDYRAASSGDVRVRIFRRDMFETVFDETVNLGVGDEAQWTDTITFPGGDQYYWLYADGPEDVYTTAIYITGKGYNINLEASPEEGGTVAGEGNYDPGEPVVVEAAAHPDYYFHRWTEDGEEVSRDEVYTFTSERHRNLKANFRPRLFTFETSAISAGTTSYAIDSEGNVWEWRDGEPQKYSKDLWGGEPAVDVSAGNSYCRDYEYVFVVTRDGRLWSWGNCNYGQLGHGEAVQETVNPVEITSTNWNGFNVLSVHAGNYTNHVFALTDDGSLWSWGHYRHTGLPEPAEGFAVTVPARIEQTRYMHGSGTLISTSEVWNGEDVTYASAGTSLNIAVTSDGNIWTWGTGRLQLGHGTLHNYMDRPVLVESTNWGGSNVSTVAAGDGFAAALTADGNVWTWGRSSAGQPGWSVLGHGDGDTEDKPVPTRITSTNWNGSQVTQITAGHVHMNALTADGNVWAWGRNYKGELGFNDFEDRTEPEMIETTDWDGQMVVEISTVKINYPNRALRTGDLYNLALTADGTLWYWGNLNEELTAFPEEHR